MIEMVITVATHRVPVGEQCIIRNFEGGVVP
jgi:hypothetical protein